MQWLSHKSLTLSLLYFVWQIIPIIIISHFVFFSLFHFSPYRIEKFDHFSQPKHGYDNVGGDIDSPASFDEIERPPLRHIDKYVRAELFGLSARFTVAFMAMMGFIISFGMKCNLSPAKMERDRASWEAEAPKWNNVTVSLFYSLNFFLSWMKSILWYGFHRLIISRLASLNY